MANKDLPAQRKKMRRTFQQFDQHGDGKIGLLQLGDCLRILGANPSEKSIRQHTQQLRDNQIERISFDEVMSIYESIMSLAAVYQAGPGSVADQLIFGLRLFDEKNTGYIKAAWLGRILTSCGEHLTQDEMNELLADRVNDQGLVNYVEFVHAITTPNVDHINSSYTKQ
ncbi:myosin-2 essential light chain [Drosophila virilis]|uniref:EF-hand domain-containing protein n=1 Tax=Drosophila virilis TaxID=7244 RepID=B4LQN1_DROVI|nr:myosin-2 essential light chain [Drosophila virilis]EDW64488.1 uncharacterized protein Dvir_GJ22292 [Drosophila virilis]